MEDTEINRLRSMGYGYVKIAQMLGLAENTVKSYCRGIRTRARKEYARGAGERWTADGVSAVMLVGLHGGICIRSIQVERNRPNLFAKTAGNRSWGTCPKDQDTAAMPAISRQGMRPVF